MKKFASLLSQFFAFFWSLLPWRVNRLVGKFLAVLWFDLFQIRRQVVLDNISMAFPEMPMIRKIEIGRQSMQNLCRSFFDVIKIPSLSDSWIDQNVIFSGQEVIGRYKNKGGLLFLTLHMGSGDLATAVISQRLVPCTLISKRLRSIFLDEFWFSLRGKSKTQFIDAHSQRNAFDILAALKNKRAVVFVLDQFMGKPYGVETEFFGHKTGTAYGLALFARKTQLPVIPVFTYWGKDDHLHINFSEPIALSDDLSQTYEHMTNQFNQVLEKIITQFPDQWMWLHRRWKTFE